MCNCLISMHQLMQNMHAHPRWHTKFGWHRFVSQISFTPYIQIQCHVWHHAMMTSMHIFWQETMESIAATSCIPCMRLVLSDNDTDIYEEHNRCTLLYLSDMSRCFDVHGAQCCRPS